MQPNTQMPGQNPNGPDFGFIMQDKPLAKKSPLPLPSGLPGKLLFGCLGIFIFIVLFSLIKGLVSPGVNYTGFITVAQDQQAIVYTLDNAAKQTVLSEPTKEFVFMAQLSIANDQKEVMKYLSRNNQKIESKKLTLKIRSATTTKLTQAATTSPGAYEAAFREVIKEQLTTYQKDMKTAYASFKGQNGRLVLDKAYSNSELLVKKLETR